MAPPPSKYRAKWNSGIRTFSFIVPIMIVVMIVVLFINATFRGNIFFIFLALLITFLGFLLTIRGAIVFFNSLYDPPEDINTTKLIMMRLLGLGIRNPFVVINIALVDEGKFELQNEFIYWLGGPAILIIYDGTGVYIERGNRFSRTLGPGITFLDRFERVRDIVDLRPQTMSSGQEGFPRPISGRTKDGVKIEFNIAIKFHILRPDSSSAEELKSDQEKPAKNNDISLEARKTFINRPKAIHSGDLQAIKRAVERTAVRYRDSIYSESNWRDSVWGAVSGRLAKYVTQYYLDELLTFENMTGVSRDEPIGSNGTAKAGQLLSGLSRETIRQELDSTLQTNLGVTLSDLYVTSLSIPQEVYNQYRKLFDVDRKNQLIRTEGGVILDKIRIREEKRAQAQKDLITEIADAFKNIDDKNFTDSVLLSLSGLLDQGLEDMAIPSILAKDNLDTLKQLRDFLNNNDNS